MSYRIPIKMVNSALTYIFDKVSSFALNVIISGFTKLGSDAPAIKIKELTGTTNAVEGGSESIPHNLTGDKIIGWTAKVIFTTNRGVAPGGLTSNAGFSFTCFHTDTDFSIVNHPTDSENILSKPFTILVFYKE